MTKPKPWRALIGLGICVAMVGLAAWWKFHGPRLDTPAGGSSASGADPVATDPPTSRSPSGGKLDAAQTPWQLEKPRSDARNSPADLRQRPAVGQVPCKESVGRWRMSPVTEIVLKPFGEVGRVSGNEVLPEPESSWTCTQAGDVELFLPEGRFTGNVNDPVDFALTGPNGTRLEWQEGSKTEAFWQPDVSTDAR